MVEFNDFKNEKKKRAPALLRQLQAINESSAKTRSLPPEVTQKKKHSLTR